MARIAGIPYDKAGPYVKLAYRFTRHAVAKLTGGRVSPPGGAEDDLAAFHDELYERRLGNGDELLVIEPSVRERDGEVGIVATRIFQRKLERGAPRGRKLSRSLSLPAAVLSRA